MLNQCGHRMNHEHTHTHMYWDGADGHVLSSTCHCISLCTISSLLMRCVVLLTSIIRELRFSDQLLSTSLGSLTCLKLTMPAGRSILAYIVFLVTKPERNSSTSCSEECEGEGKGEIPKYLVRQEKQD